MWPETPDSRTGRVKVWQPRQLAALATAVRPESAATAAIVGPETPTAAMAARVLRRPEPARVRPARRMRPRWPAMAATRRPVGLPAELAARAAMAATPGMAPPARRS